MATLIGEIVLTIYLLDQNPTTCAQMLDDKSLDKQIKAIANLLCFVHSYKEFIKHDTKFDLYHKDIPLKPLRINLDWQYWARECKQNYKFLVQLGLACCREWFYRGRDDYWDKEYPYNFDSKIEYENRYPSLYWPKFHYRQSVIEWARDNVPSLPLLAEYQKSPHTRVYTVHETPFPLVMPRKYATLAIFNPDNFYTSDHIDNIVYTYRNYYKAKLEKMEEKAWCCNDCICVYSSGYDTSLLPKWTRRKKPDWLDICYYLEEKNK